MTGDIDVTATAAWVAGGGGVIAYLTHTGLKMLRGVRHEGAEGIKDKAESTLYAHLSEQVEQLRRIADQAFTERTALTLTVAELKGKAERYDALECLVEKLKEKLEQKDEIMRRAYDQFTDERNTFMAILTQKDQTIARQDAKIDDLQKALRDLELRVARDEAKSSQMECPFRGVHVPPVTIAKAGG